MQDSELLDILKTLLDSGVLNDSHILLILTFFILFLIKKFYTPFKESFDNIANKNDIDSIDKKLNQLDDKIEKCFKDLNTDIKHLNEKLDNMANKEDTNIVEIVNIKSELIVIKKYLDNFYFNSHKN